MSSGALRLRIAEGLYRKANRVLRKVTLSCVIQEKHIAKRNKILDKILRGTSDASIGFTDLCHLLILLGFEERIRGDHHIFTKDGVIEILHLQPKGS